MPGPLQGNVKVPALGEMPKVAVFGGLAVTGYLIYRSRTKSASTTAANPPAGSDPYPPDGTTGNPNDPYSTDPATGVTYGDEQIGYGAGLGAGVTGLGAGGGTTDTTVGTQITNGPPFTTNAAWSQYVIQYLTQTQAMDGPTVTDAIGLYIQGQPVTSAQKIIINDAIAVGGQPPVTGTNGFPPSINVSGSVSGGGNATNPVTGLKVAATRDGGHVTWTAAHNAGSYEVSVFDPDGSRHQHTTVTGTSETLTGLHLKGTYKVHVLAKPAAPSAHDAVVSLHIK